MSNRLRMTRAEKDALAEAIRGTFCYRESEEPEKPTIDAVPVVRCKDCRYWRQEVSPTEHWVCAHHSFNERKMYTTPDFYCADGERKEV